MRSLLFACALGIAGSTSPTDDKIASLPELTWNVNYNQYSGFLDLDNGHHLHYWFVESQNDPSSDPVTLWLNGGPGCSSLDGLVYENGPFHLNHSGNMYENAYAWNLNSNMLYLESPIGVGFSYSDNGEYHMNDETTADDNYHALIKFFEAYTEYSENDFYVTGESYGGVYVPTLVETILKGNADTNTTLKINIKGFAVGNGVTNDEYLDASSVWFAYHHGLIDDILWNSLLGSCCHSPYDRQSCDFGDSAKAPNTVACEYNLAKVQDVIYNGKLNWYNIYGDCFTTVETIIENNNIDSYLKYWRLLDMRLNKEYSQTFDKYLTNLNEAVPCIDSTGADIYLNRNDVKEAIHVINNKTSNIEWSICSSTLKYKSLYSDLASTYLSIFNLDSDIYGVVYNGDTDMACNFLGDEWFVEDLNFTALNDYREWFVDATQSYNAPQVGGWTIDYDRISFVTVRGSGHMVPQYKPQAALKMFQYFLKHQQL